jgi:hypothetical protein
VAITRNAREVRFWLNQRFGPRAKKYFFSVFFAKMRREKYTCGIARPLRGGLDFVGVAISGFERRRG